MVERVELAGRHVMLEPMQRAQIDGLFAAASEDRATYAFTLVPHDDASTREYVETALADEAAGTALPFTIRLRDDGRIVGTSRFLDLDFWPGDGDPDAPSTAEIGSTWLAASVQATHVNPEAKLLMLTHAFDVWDVHRITFKTDARNERSRRAIERLGAQFEGIRRAHRLAYDGGIRDSAYFSIVRAEWPGVRVGLEARLAEPVSRRAPQPAR
jgi:RimJ/RimL family protein N-acetyltransferase